MNLLDWLFGRAPSEKTPAPMPSAPAAQPRGIAPETEDSTEELRAPDGDGRIELDEVYTVIDYTDAQGRESRRRITLRKIATGSNGPILSAICHERRALRHFRIDRIGCFIDPEDGEVMSPDTFLRDVLSIDVKALGGPDEALAAACVLRETLRPALSILVLAARADGEFHEEELDVICRYAECEAEALADEGRTEAPDLATLDALTDLVARMRPSAESLRCHLDRVFHWQGDRARRFERALADVIRADGEIDAAEELLLDDIAAARARFLEAESETLEQLQRGGGR